MSEFDYQFWLYLACGVTGGLIGYVSAWFYFKKVMARLMGWQMDTRLWTYCPPREEETLPPHPAHLARLEMTRWRAQKARREELLRQEWTP